MNIPAQSKNNDHTTLPTRLPGEYTTLKKSLSASFGHVSPSKAQNEAPVKGSDDGARTPVPRSGSPPLSVNIPKMPNMVDASLAALRYLPTPLLVLSSWKTVILANEAMGRLLGLDGRDQRQTRNKEGQEPLGVDFFLKGQSMSQIGIDMLQDGQRIWVSWEVRGRSDTHHRGRAVDTHYRNFWTPLQMRWTVLQTTPPKRNSNGQLQIRKTPAQMRAIPQQQHLQSSRESLVAVLGVGLWCTTLLLTLP